jgi:apolipoprotein D and lipocalin family protein
LILVLLVLVACGPRPEPDVPDRRFRPVDAPIYSSAVVEQGRLSGHWLQVATFAPGGQAPCAPGTVDFDGSTVQWDLCLPTGARIGAGPMVAGKPGRFSVGGMADWWVLWVDADYRTLVIGTPSGDFGFVLNRDAVLPSDRLKAVRDIVQFNGYPIDGLVVF